MHSKPLLYLYWSRGALLPFSSIWRFLFTFLPFAFLLYSWQSSLVTILVYYVSSFLSSLSSLPETKKGRGSLVTILVYYVSSFLSSLSSLPETKQVSKEGQHNNNNQAPFQIPSKLEALYFISFFPFSQVRIKIKLNLKLERHINLVLT